MKWLLLDIEAGLQATHAAFAWGLLVGQLEFTCFCKRAQFKALPGATRAALVWLLDRRLLCERQQECTCYFRGAQFLALLEATRAAFAWGLLGGSSSSRAFASVLNSKRCLERRAQHSFGCSTDDCCVNGSRSARVISDVLKS